MHVYVYSFVSNDMLTWHDDVIPSNEIWIKLGGDKGGGTFKMTFQICNTQNPNSPSNTYIFSIFMAYDSVTNLHIGLDKYTEQVKDLQKTKWRYVHDLMHISHQCTPTQQLSQKDIISNQRTPTQQSNQMRTHF